MDPIDDSQPLMIPDDSPPPMIPHEISRSNLPPPPPPPQSSTLDNTVDTASDLLMDEDGQGLLLDNSMINSTLGFSTSTFTVLPNVLSLSPPQSPSKSPSHSVESTQLDDDEEANVTSGTSEESRQQQQQSPQQQPQQQPLGSAAVPPSPPAVPPFPAAAGGALDADSFLSSQPASHFDQQPANPPQLLNKEESQPRLRASETTRTSASMSTESTSSSVSSSSCSCPFVLGE